MKQTFDVLEAIYPGLPIVYQCDLTDLTATAMTPILLFEFGKTTFVTRKAF
jgi:hypothetical protein